MGTILLQGFLLACGDSSSPLSVNFTTIEKGIGGSPTGSSKEFHIITDESAWNEYWLQLHGQNSTPPPPIDFTKEMVIGVHFVVFDCCASEAEIREILLTADNRLEVRVQFDFCPGPMLVISSPLHIVKLQKLGNPVTFVETQSVCSP